MAGALSSHRHIEKPSNVGAPARARTALKDFKIIDRIAARTYCWCLAHGMRRWRGGCRLQRIVGRFSLTLRSYPVAQPYGTVYVDMTDETWLSEHLSRYPNATHEPHIQRVLAALIEPTDTVVDIGANLGWHTLVMSRLAKRVIAFEPNPTILPLLRKTLYSCTNVELHECAALDYYGTVRFFVSPNHFISSIYDGREGAIETVVPCKCLLDVLDSQVDLIKIDAEGAEAKILQCASPVLDQERAPFLIYETWSPHETERRPPLENFKKARYKDLFIQRNGELSEHFNGEDKWCEVLAIPEARMDSALRRIDSAPALRDAVRI
jgi:FkbM family methyltransferase